ncbi:hypothetical protein Agub_g2343 [Astrephomene gubernaculifera]|uniref:Protein kinase domain-containing protein n=1 Tax=Astrephomene gubernaculifera TaxID=47775 RepID=A0AAD3DJ19_9CHLO|nr:hypothetical protein Agub_g2343 [Astrephomene gubernaculifera]
MERSKELSFSVRNSGDVAQPVGSSPGFVGDLQLLSGEELEARLQIHERIGGGSSARVYRGTLDSSVPVAIKVLHPHAAQRESTLQEFWREAQILARLQHKHIVRLHALAHLPPNFGGLPTRRYTWGIVTEYMEAGTVTKLVQDAAKAYKLQQRFRQQLAAAAAAAAAGGISAAQPERSGSLRNLKNSLSFLRRRSLTAEGAAVAPPSPMKRAAAALQQAVSPSGGGGGVAAAATAVAVTAANQPGVSSRVPSVMHEAPPPLPYSDREALQWCMELALALQFLHAQTPPVVHRDVKTDNVLMAVAAAEYWVFPAHMAVWHGGCCP